MIKFLIVENDLKYAKKIISNIIKENEQIRLIDIISSPELDDTISAIRKCRPHICIMNSDLINVDKILSFPYPTAFICVTDDPLKSAIKKFYLKDDITPVKEQVKKLIKETEYNRIKDYIESELYNLKFDFELKGTMYLVESILFSYYHSNPFVYENLEKNVYPEIAKKFNTTMYHVKWGIIQAVNHMYDLNYSEGTLRSLCDYFYFSTNYKPTAKIIITTFLAKLYY